MYQVLSIKYKTVILNLIQDLSRFRNKRSLRLRLKFGMTQQGFIRITKKTLITTLGVWIVIVSSGLLYLFGPWTQTTEAAWFNDDWGFRETAKFSGSLNNEKVLIDIDTATLITAGKMQADCGDARFTSYAGDILEYYLDAAGGACNTNSTDFYVLIPTNFGSAATIYFYYGNSIAENGTEGANFTQSTDASTITLGSEESAPSPILYWKFDDATDTNAEDATANALDGTLNNTPTWKTEDMCVAVKCLSFDGANNENVSKADNALLDFIAADKFTVSAWVKRTGASSAINYILTKAQSGYTGYKLYQDASGDYCFDVSDGTNTDTACTSAVEFDDDQWHFVAGVKDGTSSITLYVDGKSRATDASIAATGTLANTGTFYTGVDLDGTSNEWLGFIDEVKVFRDQTARTAAQVAADFNARSNPEGVAIATANAQNSPAVLANGLVGFWKMDELSGDAADSSGNGLTLTNNNTTAFAGGKFYYSGSFTASSSHYFSTASTINSVKTVAFWANPSANTDEYLNLTASAYITSSSGTVSGTGFTSPSVYVNGVLNGTVTANTWNLIVVTSETGINANAFEVGRANGAYANGNIDEVRLYSRPLSSADVVSLYNFAPTPVGYWKFEERTGTSASDLSGNATTGTLRNMASPATSTSGWGKGYYGTGLNFDGSDDYVDTANTSILASAASAAYGAWFKLAATPTGGTINTVMASSSLSFDNGIGLEADATNFFCNIRTSGGDSLASVAIATITPKTWFHGFCSWTSGEGVKLYLNGALVATGTTRAGTLSNLSGTPLNIGAQHTTPTRTWNGQIDDVRVYNYARTGGQIVADMNAGHPAPGSPIGTPVGYYKFDEGADNTCSGGTNDVCNSGNGGTTLDGTSTATRTNIAKYGKSLSFDGSDDVATITNASAIDMDLNLAKFSYSAWIYPETDGENDVGQILQKGTSTYFRVDTQDASGNLDLEANLDLATTDANVNIADGLKMADWSYVTMTWDGTTLRVYVNGVEKGSSSAGSGAISADANNLLIGGTTTANFDGKIDELRVYNQALTAPQVLIDMQRAAGATLGALTTNNLNEDRLPVVDPTAISNMKLWLKADSISASEGDVIDTWSDSSGTGNDAVMVTAGQQPSYRRGVINGMPALRFDGTDRMNPTTTGFPSGNSNVTVFTVYTSTDANDQRVFSYGNSTAGTRTNLSITAFDNNTIRSSIGGSGTNVDADLLTDRTSNSYRSHPVIQTFRYTASSLLMETYAPVQGTSATDTLAGSANLSTTTGKVGSSPGNTNFHQGFIAEIILYADTLTETQRIGVEAYLMQKYGLLPNVNSSVAEYCQPGMYDGCATPIGEWKFEEGTGTSVADTSGLANTGTWAGTGSHWTRGKIGKGGNFNGTDDEVDVGDMTGTESFRALTWTFWIKPDGASATQCIICKFDSDTTDTSWGITLESGNVIRAYIPSSTTSLSQYATIDTGITPGQWYFVAVTYDGDNSDNGDRIEILINGQKVAATFTGTIPGITQATSSNATIGASSDGANFFDGVVDNVRIYNYRKKPPGLGWEFNKGQPSHWWRLDECQGSTLNDGGINANGVTAGANATITIGASGTQTTAGTCAGATGAWGNGITGKYNSSLNLDGTDDYAITGSSPGLPTEDFTYSAWVNATSFASTNKHIFTAEDGSGNDEFKLKINTSGAVVVTINDTDVLTTDRLLTTSTWYHIAAVRLINNDAPGSIYVYINGVQDTQTTASGTAVLNFSTCALAIGADLGTGCGTTPGNYFAGKLDDLKIYPYALSPYQVKQLYNQGAGVRVGPVTGTP